jgi:hypothetical protein
MIDKPLLQNTNHLFNPAQARQKKASIGRIYFSKRYLAVPNTKILIEANQQAAKRFSNIPKRDGSIKEFRRKSQEPIEQLQTLQPGHRKNTRSMKFDQGTLKAMLVEKLQKRYDINQELVTKRALEKVELYGTQQNFRKTPTKMFDTKSTGRLSQKKFVKRRKSRQGSKESIRKNKHHVFR